MPRPLGLRPRSLILLVIASYAGIFAVISLVTGDWNAAFGWMSTCTLAGFLAHDGLRIRQLHDDIGQLNHGDRWVRATVPTPAFLPPLSHQCPNCLDMIEVGDPRHLAEVVEYHEKITCTANRTQS